MNSSDIKKILERLASTSVDDAFLIEFDDYVRKVPPNTQAEIDSKVSQADLVAHGYVGGQLRIIASATYTLLEYDYILHVEYSLTGVVTITLPDALLDSKCRFYVKDADGNASVNNITIDPEGATTIDGAATAVINTDYGSVGIYSDGSNWFTF